VSRAMSAKMAAGTMGPSDEGTLGATLGQEARLFRELYLRRSQQYASVAVETRSVVAEADQADAELVYMLDRAQFAEDQLEQLVSHGWTGGPNELANRWRWMQHRRLSEAAEEALQKHQELCSELAEWREHSAVAIAHLRALRALGALSGSEVHSGVENSLASVLRRCEESLLKAGSSWGEIASLAAEFEAISPLGLVLPILQGLNSKASKPVEMGIPQLDYGRFNLCFPPLISMTSLKEAFHL